MRAVLCCGLVVVLALAADSAQAQASSPTPTTALDAVVVAGAQPGPRLWKVSKDGHVLWILGLQSPLPKDIEWASGEAAARIRESQEILRPPTAKLDADIGFFGGLALLPSAMGARKNPDGKSLQQVLPPEIYARWLPLKQRYLGRDNGVEKFRPIFAAGELWDAALKRSGLTQKNLVWPVIEDIADDADVKMTTPGITLKLADPGKALKQFKASGLDDVSCFERTLSRIEGDLDGMRQRANAWAVGDVATLRALPHADAASACESAFLSAGVSKQRGFDNIPERLAAAWLAQAERALAEHTSSFAVLPMRELLDANGYVARLRAKGYTVETRE